MAIRSIGAKLKAGAPFLIYLYYALDNRPWWYRAIWRASDVLRRLISRLPRGLRLLISQIIAISVYWPLARFADSVPYWCAVGRKLPLPTRCLSDRGRDRSGH